MIFRNAIPIWIKEKENTLNETLAFYVELKNIKNAELVITASCRYKAFLNGKMIAFGPARTAHGYFRADRIPLWNDRENGVLFLIVCGYNTYNYQSLIQPSFLQAEIFVGQESVLWTGRDFFVREYKEKIRKVTRFSYQRPFVESYRFEQSIGEKTFVDFDRKAFKMPDSAMGGKVIERGSNYPEYDCRASNLIECGRFFEGAGEIERNIATEMEALRIFPLNELETYPADYIYRLQYEKQKMKESFAENEYALFDFRKVETGFINICFTAEEDSVVWLIYDEIDLNTDKNLAADVRFYRNGCVNIIEYKVKRGEYNYQSMEPYTARYVKVLVGKGKISNVKTEVVSFENPDTDKFVFKCADKKIEEIIDAAKRTFAHNAVDLLTDCPSRERAGWLTDSYFSGRSEKLITGKNNVELDFLQNFALTSKVDKIPDGMLPMCYPADFVEERYIPNWAMWYIIEICDVVKRTGDGTIARIHADKVHNAIGFFDKYVNEDGLLENLESWIFVEWSKANDEEFVKGVNYPSNMLFALALEEAGRLYENQLYIERAEKMRVKIREQSFNGEFFEDNRVRENGKLVLKGHISETCQYYAFFTKTADKESYSTLFNLLRDKFGAKRDVEKVYPYVYKSNAFIGDYLRLLIWANSGELARIGEECIDFFYNMAAQTGTLWENDSFYGSLDHGFASYAAVLLTEYVCGFKGARGRELLFSNSASDVDCQLRIPLEDGEIVFTRKNKKEALIIPEGYQLVEI